MESENKNSMSASVETPEDLINPVEQMRPDSSFETINTPPSAQEVKAAVEELNPDENSMNSRG